MNRRILSLFFLLVSFSAIAQVGWERLYPIDMRYEHLTIDGMDFQDGYLRLALTTERDSSIYHHANLVKIDMKGTNEWSRDIVVADSLPLYKEGDLAVLDNKNIAISLAGLKDSLNHFIAVTDPVGEILWSKQYAVYQDSSAFDVVKPRVVQSRLDTMSLYHAGIGLYEGVQQIFVSKLNAEDGLTQWSNYVNIDGGELIFGSIEACREGGVIIQAIDKATEQFVITRIDADGNLMYNKAISSSTLSPTDSESNSITELADSTYVMIGNYFDMGVEYDGYIVKLDSVAEVDWAKRVDFDFSFNNVTLLDVVESIDNNILISGKQVGVLDTAAFGMKLDYDGAVVWKSKFKVTDVENIQLGGLGQANDGGLSFFLTGGNEEAEQYIPYLITTDADGMTLCSEELEDILFDASFSADTLELISTPFDPTFTEYCCVGNSHIGDDRDNVVISTKQYDGANYILGHNNRDNGDRLGFLSKLDADGSLEWTFEMETPSYFFEFVKTSDDNLIIVGREEPFNISTNNNALLISVDDDGQLIESRIYDITGRDMFTDIIVHADAIDPTNAIYVSGRTNKDDNPSAVDDAILLNLNNQLDINWTLRINHEGRDTEIDKIIASSDGHIVMGGFVDPQDEIYAKINGLNGSLITAKIAATNNYSRKMASLPDGRFVVASGYDNASNFYLLDQDLNYVNGFSFDAEVRLINNIEVGGVSNVFNTFDVGGIPMTGITNVGTNGLVFSKARYFDGNTTGSTIPVLEVDGSDIRYADSRVNPDGDLDVFHYTGSIADMVDCTFERDIATTAVSHTFTDTTLNITLDTLESMMGAEITDLDWMREDYCENISFEECLAIEMTSRTFGGFNLPTVMLNTRNFCPNEPIEWTFDASTPGAIAYNWENEDGDVVGTADTLFVTDAELYKVTVTIGEDVCYQLCAEAEVGVFDEPTLSPSFNGGDFCTTGNFTLFAGPVANSGIDSLNWSNGDMGTSIMVAEPGVYTVTLVDNCGLSVEGSVDVSNEFPVLIESISITDEGTTFCQQPEITLSTIINPDNAPFSTAEWATGEMSLNLDVNAGGTYNIAVVDDCGNPFEASITIAEVPITLDTLPIIRRDCLGDSILLKASEVYPSNFTFLWTPGGATTPTVTVPFENQTYTLDITDSCDETMTATFDVNEDDCVDIRWPNAFIPSSDLEDGVNKEFGPVIGDGTEVTDYTLKIYNRWGEIVFESDDPEDRWDGVWKENQQPGDVYLYIASYTLFGREILQKGDLTLLR